MVFGDRIKPLNSKHRSTIDDPEDARPESAGSADPEDRDRTTDDPATVQHQETGRRTATLLTPTVRQCISQVSS